MEKVMDEKQIIQSLSNMLQKRNNEIINLELRIESLTAQIKADTKKEEIEKDTPSEEQDI
jgi:Skp family chaperone for outer membrane proteins